MLRTVSLTREPFYYLRYLEPKKLKIKQELSTSLMGKSGYPVLLLEARNLSTDEVRTILQRELGDRKLVFPFKLPLIGTFRWPSENIGFNLDQVILFYLIVKTESEELKRSLRHWNSYPLFDEGNKHLLVSFVGETQQDNLSHRLTLEIKFPLKKVSWRSKIMSLDRIFTTRRILNLYGHSEFVTSWLNLVPKILKGLSLEISEEYVQRLIYRRLRGTPWDGRVKRKQRFGTTLKLIAKPLLREVFPSFQRMLWNWFLTELTFSRRWTYRLVLDSEFHILERASLVRNERSETLFLPSAAASYDRDKWRILAGILNSLSLDISHLALIFEGNPVFPYLKRRTNYRVFSLMADILGNDVVLKVRIPVWASPEAFIMGLYWILSSGGAV